MSNIPTSYRFRETHEWVCVVDGNKIKVGISDHAQSQLGDLVYVELPEVNSNFNAGDSCAVVESVKAASDVYCPVSGEVVEVNESLVDNPELVNQSAYDEGWLFALKASDLSDIDELLGSEKYQALISED